MRNVLLTQNFNLRHRCTKSFSTTKVKNEDREVEQASQQIKASGGKISVEHFNMAH